MNGLFFMRLMDTNGEEIKVTEEEMQKAFATCLKNLRKYKHLTLKHVAKETNINIPTLQRYEKGENVPSVIQAFKLSYFHKIELTDMFFAGYIDEESRENFFDNLFKKKT